MFVQQQIDSGLFLGQSRPDETEWVLLLQVKRQQTVTQAGVSADETCSGQRCENQEVLLRTPLFFFFELIKKKM